MERYQNLFRLIRQHNSRRIVEIGVFDGNHGAQMIEAAMIQHKAADIHYYGFDLFEEMTASTFDTEFSKVPLPMHAVDDKLSHTGANIDLIRGNTKETLPVFLDKLTDIDFIFIDGGHSVATIASDWGNLRQVMNERTVVVFDDYYIDAPPALDGIGCNALVDRLDRRWYSVEFLLQVDSFPKEWGMLNVQMVKVMLNA